jgi:hypothetical protein
VNTGENRQAGIRYIPEIVYSVPAAKRTEIDADIALNSYVSDSNSDLKLYRFWARYSAPRTEARLGLQKINFGPARILRSLMWFDRLDYRDPLRLTEGVYGFLLRRYFLNNANIWTWILYGNGGTKGLETVETHRRRPEFGGRYQFPFRKGEVSFSLHRRFTESGGHENRLGFDAMWDIGPGIWFENAISEIRQADEESGWRNFLTIGTDYTFDILTGVHVLYEHFIFSKESLTEAHVSALSADLSVSMIDRLNGVCYYDWEGRKTYGYLGLERAYDKWRIILSVFSGMDEQNLYSDAGANLMVIFNH